MRGDQISWNLRKQLKDRQLWCRLMAFLGSESAFSESFLRCRDNEELENFFCVCSDLCLIHSCFFFFPSMSRIFQLLGHW